MGNELNKEYALELGRRGAMVVVNDFGGSVHGEGGSTNAADAVCEEIVAAGGSAMPNYSSVTDTDQVLDPIIKEFGRVDILINNAGILRDKNMLRISDNDWDEIINVHLSAPFRLPAPSFPL